MKNIMTDFEISSDYINNGINQELIRCSNCNKSLIASNIFKYTYCKIKTLRCSDCNKVIKLGDIYNFKTGSKLNRINTHHTQTTLDNKIWGGKFY